jgi:hypothetical protein
VASDPVSRPGPVNLRLAEAQAATRRGDVAHAERLLREGLADNPGDPQVLNALGMIALGRGDDQEARGLFEGASAADPGAAALWMNLATACRRLKDDESERDALERALAIDQRNFIALLRLAEQHERRGETRDAALRWSAVVQIASAAADRPPVVEQALEHGRRFLAGQGETVHRRINEALGDRLAELGPAARRFQACMDHSLRGRPIYANECSGVHFPFLPADEYFDRHHFPWLEQLEARTPAIRAEAERLLASGDAALRPYVRQDAGTPENKWSALDNNLAWGACFLWEYGVRNDPVCELCPETAAALAAVPQNIVPGKAPTAFFSILKAGAHIPAHTGVTNTRAIVHLPLIVPPGCEFRVGGETRAWREAEAFVFDDTIEHEAWNRSDRDRVVLIFDVWNPHLSEGERALLADFFTLADQPAVA